MRTIETCLTASTNSQYVLRMLDSGNVAWSSGAWLEVYGVNGNLALKVMMTETSQESVNMSLYAPINKNAEWKLSSSADNSWKEVDFADASWTSVSLGSTTQQVTGTQYLRRAFTGLSNMAAVQIALNYRFGIIAYINGQQVYRDNMPEGEVTSATVATGGYSSYDYRGIYRSAAVASATQSVLAVELHFIDSTPSTIEFNAFLALYAGISSDNNCYVAPPDYTVTSTTVRDKDNVINWTRGSSAMVGGPGVLTFTSTGFPLMISSLRIWPDTHTANHPSSFSLGGSTSATGTFTEISRQRMHSTLLTSGPSSIA